LIALSMSLEGVSGSPDGDTSLRAWFCATERSVRSHPAFRHTAVPTVETGAQELRLHQSHKHSVANRSFKAAEALRLRGGEAQSRHFQKLATDAPDGIVNRFHAAPLCVEGDRYL
jgi:hypothetical protein